MAGRLPQFVKQQKRIIRHQEVLSIVKGYQIPFTNLPVQEKARKNNKDVRTTISASGPGNIKFGKKGAIQKAETGQQRF